MQSKDAVPDGKLFNADPDHKHLNAETAKAAKAAKGLLRDLRGLRV